MAFGLLFGMLNLGSINSDDKSNIEYILIKSGGGDVGLNGTSHSAPDSLYLGRS